MANLNDSFAIKRSKGAWWAGILVFAIALLPALSTSALSEVRYGGKGIIELFDNALINWMLPIAALIISQVVCYRLSEKLKKQEFISDEMTASNKLYGHWIFILKWCVPLVIITALALQIMGLMS